MQVRRTVKSDCLLLLTACIWGFAFVAQRAGMEFVGPFTFNGIRFALGSLSLVPLILYQRRRELGSGTLQPKASLSTLLTGGMLAGLAIFIGASFQQIGLVYTTAGKAGFITGLYVIIVPVLGLFWRIYPNVGTWVGAIMAAIGLYFLSVTEQFTIAFGDLLELIGAFFWAAHVLLIGWYSPRINNLMLACFQFSVCSVMSLIAALILEDIALQGILDAAVPILYGGVCSVGVAYTLQVVAQKDAPPSHAAIILSLEAVFAAIGGWLILEETMTSRGLLGCSLMLVGMILSQTGSLLFKSKKSQKNQDNLSEESI